MVKINHIIEREYISRGKLRDLLSSCYQCVGCSSICQMGRVQDYTPSKIIQLIIEGFEEQVISSGIFWDCLTCNSCLQLCPYNINFSEIVRDARKEMIERGIEPNIAHKGFYTLISEIMSKENITPNRTFEWIPPECDITDRGEILYFVGCTPFFDFEFPGFSNIAIDSLKILCKIEKKPIVVLRDEICCGHDLLWQGKIETFKKLAKKNIKAFKKSNASVIITSCAEGYRTLKIDYPNLCDDFNIKIKHLIEYIYEKLIENKITFKNIDDSTNNINLTFHDPCRLSRFLPNSSELCEMVRYIFEKLREIGYNFQEMDHNKTNSICCGVSCWLNCSDKTKALRIERMKEAKKIADNLITICPKCELHFKCTQNDSKKFKNLKISDFSNLLIKVIDFK